MRRPAPESRALRSIVAWVLMQRGIQTECEDAMDPRPGGRGGETLAVGAGALSPRCRRVNLLEKSGICGDAREGPRTVGAVGMKQQLALPIQRSNRYSRGLRRCCNWAWTNLCIRGRGNVCN